MGKTKKVILEACAALSKTVRGRCRKTRCEDGILCSQHQDVEGVQTLEGLERKILIKFTLPTSLNDEAEQAGIRWAGHDPIGDSVAMKNIMGEAVADELGRDFWAYRSDVGDNGSLIHDPKLSMVSLATLVSELTAAGYRLVDIHRKQRKMNKPGSTLVVQFYPEKFINWDPKPIPGNAQAFIDRLCGLCWADCFIYSNAFNMQKGGIVETVNFTSPGPNAPQEELLWANGLWQHRSLEQS